MFKKVIFLVGTLCFTTSIVKAEIPQFWKVSAYAMECVDADIKDVFADFGKSFGVSVDVNDNVVGTCQGWLRHESAEEFLNAIAIEYQLSWYLFNDVLHISNTNDNVIKRVRIDDGLYDALLEFGLLQDKFGWGSLDENQVAIISGPQSYVAHIEEITEDLKNQKEFEETSELDKEDKIHVIPLKYASVADRETVIREKTIKIPGIASILNQILNGKGPKIVKSTNDTSDLLELNKGNSVVVQADVRTNSVIVKSQGRTLEYFQDIISKLDKPQQLIEIDAVIVDINREKLLDVGVDFSAEGDRGNYQGQFSTNVLQGGSQSAGALLSIGNFGKFYASLKLLESNGDANIVANTSILTMENQPAFIDLSTTFFIRSVGERVANIDSVTTGTLLNVTPQHIQTDAGDKLKLLVDIEDGKVLDRTVDNLPVLSRSNISTKAVISKDRSLVIGGYHLQSTEKSIRSVPGLGQVPLIKHLFTAKESKTKHMERIFILTPRISPLEHNTQDYLYYDKTNVASKAVETIQNRWHKSNRHFIDQSVKLMTAMLQSGGLPKGYNYSKGIVDRIPVTCKKDNLEFTFLKKNAVYGNGIAVYRSKVINTSNKQIPVYEDVCSGKGLIGVVNIGAKTLAPKQSTLFLVSVDVAQGSINPE